MLPLDLAVNIWLIMKNLVKEQSGIIFGQVHYLAPVTNTHWLEPLECYWSIPYYMASSLGMWKQFGRENSEFQNHGKVE